MSSSLSSLCSLLPSSVLASSTASSSSRSVGKFSEFLFAPRLRKTGFVVVAVVFEGAVGRVRLAQISGRFAAVPAVSAVFGLGMPTSEILVDNLISEILYIARLDNDDDLLTTAGGGRDSVKNLLPVLSSLLHLQLIHLSLSLPLFFCSVRRRKLYGMKNARLANLYMHYMHI